MYPFIEKAPNVVECNCVTGDYSMLIETLFEGTCFAFNFDKKHVLLLRPVIRQDILPEILIQISIVTTDTIFADVGVMIIAVLNAIRCLFVKKL